MQRHKDKIQIPRYKYICKAQFRTQLAPTPCEPQQMLIYKNVFVYAFVFEYVLYIQNTYSNTNTFPNTNI